MGFLPTFVTPTDAKLLIDQVNAEYDLFDSDVEGSSAGAFKPKWAAQLQNWTLFRDHAKPSVGWLNTTSVMTQTDGYHEQLQVWKKAFANAGGTSTIAPEIKPSTDIATIAVPAAVGAAAVIALLIAVRR
jgi:hypothetical protein